MDVRIEYDANRAVAVLRRGAELSDHIWSRVSTLALSADSTARVDREQVQLRWLTLLEVAPELAGLRDRHQLRFDYDSASRDLLRRYQRDRTARKQATTSLSITVAENEVQAHLHSLGFIRKLTPQQIRDTTKLVGLRHGANFSVPGAGKSTVTLAVHTLVAPADTPLLVVAPKNAFVAWDEAFRECFGSESHPEGFRRLVGTKDEIRTLLLRRPRFSIINYEQLVSNEDAVRVFLETNSVHLVVDESHKIKSGLLSQRGASLLGLAHLPARRDILTGTPLPNSISDIVPQLRLLWPGQDLADVISETGIHQAQFRGLYVRTTKNELDLPPVRFHFESIAMSKPQLAIYGLFRREALRRLVGLGSSQVDIDAARRSVTRLIMIASNPVSVVNSLTNDRPITFRYDDPKVEALFKAIVAEEDAPKISAACTKARELASDGRKCVIWTNFRYNVIRLERLLSDLGAVTIYGHVTTGSDEDSETREGRLRLFNDLKSDCRVLIAIPAAGGEGISLHRACHDAIYVDRTYNAAHYLQSLDRIHRLGLPKDTATNITILESIAPTFAGSIDYSVRRRLAAKIAMMAKILEDTELRQLSLDEEDADIPTDPTITPEDIADVIDELERELAAD